MPCRRGHRNSRDKTGRCVECKKICYQKWYLKNKECRKSYNQKYYLENRENINANRRQNHRDDPQKFRERYRIYREANSETIREKRRKYYLENREATLANLKKKYYANPEKHREKTRRWRESNPGACEESRRLWKLANQEKEREYSRRKYAKNPEKCKERQRAWIANNPGKAKAIAANYRARKIQALPKWANLEAIEKIYANRPPGYHVDHIIPLQGKTVCGLHVEDNLQYLTASENCSKHNKLIAGAL